MPLLLMCDPHDVGIFAEIKAAATGVPTIFAYDSIPAGVGLSDQVFRGYRELFSRADELVRDCPCEAGCPSCLGAGAATNRRAKEQVRRLIAALLA